MTITHRGTLIAVAILMLALGSIAPTAVATDHRTFTVAKDGSGEYNSIQEAVDDATATVDLANHTAVISIEPGTYYTTVDATNTQNITFQAASNESVDIVAVRSNDTTALDTTGSSGITVGSYVNLYNKSTVTVGQDGNEDYLAIQDAVDQVGPGTVVEIQADDSPYNETVDVDTDYLILRAANTSQTVEINATNVENATEYDALEVNATGVVVDDSIDALDAAPAVAGGGSIDFGESSNGLLLGVVAVAVVGYVVFIRDRDG